MPHVDSGGKGTLAHCWTANRHNVRGIDPVCDWQQSSVFPPTRGGHRLCRCGPRTGETTVSAERDNNPRDSFANMIPLQDSEAHRLRSGGEQSDVVVANGTSLIAIPGDGGAVS